MTRWWHYRDCVAAECAQPLPARFRADADATPDPTRQLLDEVEAYFGERPSQQRPVVPTWPVE